MRTTFLILIISLLGNSLSAQRTCNCLHTFDSLVQRVHLDYIGLQLMPLKEKAIFAKRETAFHKKAANISAADCTKFLQDYLDRLHDKHVFVYENPVYTRPELDSFRSLVQHNKKNDQLSKDLLQQYGKPGMLEGTWTDGVYQVLIVKEGQGFNGYILPQGKGKDKGGELKASFKKEGKGFSAIVYSDKYEPVNYNAKLLKGGSLLGFNAGKLWAKTSVSNASIDPTVNYNDPAQATITRADDTTLLFTIPTFNYDWEAFGRLVKDSLAVLSNARTLIFDIRGNTGGNALYFNFIELIADKNIFPGSQGWVFASADTRKYFEGQLANSPDIYQSVLAVFEENMGRIVPGPLYPDQPLELIPSAINNVAIITDEDNISAAESFILHCKAISNRVTTFGKPTGGCIDYTSVNIIALPSGNQNIYFGYPTSTWNKKVPGFGYNKTGIPPDVYVGDKVTDKIKFVIDYYHHL